MFKVDSIEVDGFWSRSFASCDFNDDVNIIIGRNGTGKTTFMNILQAVLTVDPIGLAENDFKSVKINLKNGSKKRTIKVEKRKGIGRRYPDLSYQVSQRKFDLRLLLNDDVMPPRIRRKRALAEAAEIRQELDGIVAVSSLSVYRLRNDDDYEVLDNRGARIVSPVDYRLKSALSGLAQFLLTLSRQAQHISDKLQKDVLASILYSEDDDTPDLNVDFDKTQEKEDLTTAYTQLNASDDDTIKKIQFHVNAVADVITKIKSITEKKEATNHRSEPINIRPLEALRQTRKIIDLSLRAQEKTKDVFSHKELFLDILHDFIEDKRLTFSSGDLVISNSHGEIDYGRLSSGEKQLIILMVEALLQNRQPHIFLADEPELSLHIAWQRKIIPAIVKINPNAQVIVATHSPEVASKFKHAIKDMEDIIHE